MKTLNPKDKAPHFDLKDQKGQNVGLSDFAGKKLFLYFSPKPTPPGEPLRQRMCGTHCKNLKAKT